MRIDLAAAEAFIALSPKIALSISRYLEHIGLSPASFALEIDPIEDGHSRLLYPIQSEDILTLNRHLA